MDIAKAKSWLLIVIVCLLVCLSGVNPVKAEAYVYTLHGPYYDNGYLVNGAVQVSITWSGFPPLVFTMVSDGVTENVTTLGSSVRGVTMYWNASSALNITRIYDFTNAAITDIYIFIPHPDSVVQPYSFSVTDFASMTNPFFQLSIQPTGSTTYLIEQRNLNSSSNPTFWLTQYGLYIMSVTCDQGTYTQSFFAENTYSTTIPILSGMFPIANSSLATFDVARLNGTAVKMTYVDGSSDTDWLSINITHKSGSTTLTDYSSNTTGSSQIIVWATADATRSYTVSATASIGGVENDWILVAPKEFSANPWNGAFDWLGNNEGTLPSYTMGWPQGMTSGQIAQLVAVAVIMLFLGIGSFRNAGASCFIAWAAGGIMFALGWYNGGVSQAGASGIPLFAFAGFLAVIIHLQEKKSEGAGLS